ncbi:hypothetical protein Trydic_g11952 [Trypoxylus dichotomus]
MVDIKVQISKKNTMGRAYYSWCLIFHLYTYTVQHAIYSCPEICHCDPIDNLVNCKGRDLNSLPDGIYYEVVSLDLSHNFFTEIPSALSEFKSLEWLDLSHNQIVALNRDALNGFDGLRSLDLSNNLFQSWSDIHNQVFASAPSLTWLYLSQNSLKGFPDIANDYLSSPTLQNLFLVNCSITNINSNFLQGLPQIELLDLSYNSIDVLSDQIQSDTLITLNLTDCGLQRIQDALYSLKALQLLKVGQNRQLKYFHAKSLTLRYLDAPDCDMSTIPTGSYPALIDAVFRGNHLRELPTEAFESMEFVHNVDLSRNAISRVASDAFFGAKSLIYLDMSYNTISDLDPKTFSSNFKLKTLKLSHNYLKEVINLDVESLLELDLSMCEISRVDRTSLSQMALLEYLTLSGNFISSIPDYWDAAKLKKLDLSNCRISTLSNRTFAAMPDLRALNLRGNRLTSNIRREFFNDIQVLYLGDNSWRCDCSDVDFRELYDWLVSDVDTDLYDLICQSPATVEGYRWASACYEAWNIYHTRADRAWMYSLILILSMVLLFCVILSIKRAIRLREERDRETRAQNIIEARERLQRMRLQEHEGRIEESTNAPDPRESQRPPPYAEAINMPRLDSSHPSLAGSQFSLSGSRYNLGGSNPELKSPGQKRRRKRRKKASSSEDLRSSRTNTEMSTTSDTELNRRIYMESDV